jgi:hypothetical protein
MPCFAKKSAKKGGKMQFFTHLHNLKKHYFWLWFWLKMSAKGGIHYFWAACW